MVRAVSVDFHLEPNGAGAKLTHTIDITPRSAGLSRL
jgi:hypothetical protein